MHKLGNKVTTIANGNVATIRKAGMTITNDPQPLHMTQVLNLKPKPSERDIELLAW